MWNGQLYIDFHVSLQWQKDVLLLNSDLDNLETVHQKIAHMNYHGCTCQIFSTSEVTSESEHVCINSIQLLEYCFIIIFRKPVREISVYVFLT
jgi:hypothetical protein